MASSVVLGFFLTANIALATDYTWNGSASSDWFNPLNWTPHAVPGSGDGAIIASGSVNAGSSLSLANLTLSGGNLTGTVTIVGTMNWSGGQLNGGSSLTIATNGALNMSGNSYEALYGALTNAGTVTWTGTGTLVLQKDDYQCDVGG